MNFITRSLFGVFFITLLLSGSLFAVNWTDGGSGHLWSTGGNWSDGDPPSSDEDVQYKYSSTLKSLLFNKLICRNWSAKIQDQ